MSVLEAMGPKVLPSRKMSHHLERFSEAALPTERGDFKVVVFRDKRNGAEHVASETRAATGGEG